MVGIGVGQCPGKDGPIVRAYDAPRYADDHRPRRNDRSRHYDGVGADDALFAYLGTIQNGRVHPDNAVVPDGGVVNNGRMSQSDVLADLAYVDDRMVLYVAALAYDYWSFISAQHRERPDARSFA